MLKLLRSKYKLITVIPLYKPDFGRKEKLVKIRLIWGSGLYGGFPYMEFDPISATLIHVKAHTLTLSRSFTTLLMFSVLLQLNLGYCKVSGGK